MDSKKDRIEKEEFKLYNLNYYKGFIPNIATNLSPL